MTEPPLDAVAAARLTDMQVGAVPVSGLYDGFLSLTGSPTFVGDEAEPHGGLNAVRAATGGDRIPVGAFLVEGPTTVLVDAGFGPRDFQNRGVMVGGSLLASLALRGLDAGHVQLLALTHLHLDHIGWLADDEGTPTFPDARVCVGAADWDYFVEREPEHMPLWPSLRAALIALAAEGRVDLLDVDVDVAPGVRRLGAPGHTPGHSVYEIHDLQERLLVLGDAMYCPEQLTHTSWRALSDVDPEQAERTRERLVADLTERGGAAVGCHFPGLAPSGLPPQPSRN
jgi:glyoxylase-like metal-dependent hydrolase (beta-lactamase superfamily II)